MARRRSKRSPKMTAARRKRLSARSFALPGRRYPIDTANRARNALARVSQHGSPTEKAKVRRAVKRRYPSIGAK
jgi:hypothetical protein